MFSNSFDHYSNPVTQSYRRICRKIRNLLLIAVAVGLLILFYGVPSIQYTYRARPTGGIPGAGDKFDADYWNPISGWQLVEAGQYAKGCPIIVFIPLRHCMDLEPYQNSLTEFVLGEEFFNGNPQ